MSAVELLPHYRLRGGSLRFLDRHRIPLDEDEARVVASVAAGAFDATSPTARDVEALERLRSRAIVAVSRPARAPAGATCLVVSPHMDDAALAVGGLLCLVRDRRDVSIVNVFTDDSYAIPRWLGAEPERLRALRFAEEAVVARMLGSETVNLAHRAHGDRNGDPLDVERLERELVERLRACRARLCLVPSAIGANEDHRAVRALAPRLRAAAPEVAFFRYEDMPYAAEGGGAPPGGRELRIDVSRHVGEKLRLMEVYQTQLSRGTARRIVRHMRALGGGVRWCERLWPLEGGRGSRGPTR